MFESKYRLIVLFYVIIALSTIIEIKAEFHNDETSIQLNTQDNSLNKWKYTRNFKKDEPGRKPGLINVQKYDMGLSWFGIQTFFHQPVALTVEDLKAGNVDVAVIAAYTDMSTGRRGTQHGPNAFRNAEVYGGYGKFADSPNMSVMIDPFNELQVVDFGDAPIDIMSTERSMHAIRDYVREAAETKNKSGRNIIPVIIGGDHSLMYSDVAALVDVYKKGNVGVIHFDAHVDATQSSAGHKINHSMPVYRLINEGLVPGKNFIQIGLRGYYPDENTFKWMQKEGIQYHTMTEIDHKGWNNVKEQVLKEAENGPKYWFITFDIDVFDPAYAPGTGTPEPGGLTPREVLPLLRRICAENNVVGFDVVEFSPMLDQSGVTGLLANRVVKACLTGIAMRKKGITQKDYINPLALGEKPNIEKGK